MTKKIAIIQTGQAIKTVDEQFGGFDSMFIKAMEVEKHLTETYPVYEKLHFPKTENLAGLIITGSPSMVTEREHWSEQTIEWIKQFLTLDIPVLGVCYGHQLIAKALGGTVEYNSNGRQIGQIQLEVTTHGLNDKLLNSKESKIKFNATHLQSITALPHDVHVLGTTHIDPYHCFRYKNNIWGTQFHPEFTKPIIKEYIYARSDQIKSEGLDPDFLLNNIDDHNNGDVLLKTFKNICFNSGK